ncbi:aKG-HExxH-type peptide beta-hydroxylase [Actinoplanes sp. CA-051413]|uniref:aKG-HExxH-type peptide beta-hydroxylase n=1 Tax=Actinoplanes sp. CA-051413 TaxID=3239899 RepID=UPI003D965964
MTAAVVDWSGVLALATGLERRLAGGMFGRGDDIRRTAAAYYRGLGVLCAQTCGLDTADLAPAGVPQLESLRRGALDAGLRLLLAGDVEQGRALLGEHAAYRRTHQDDPALAADAAPGRARPGALQAWHGHPVGEELVARFNTSMAGTADTSVVATVPSRPESGTALLAAAEVLTTALPLIGPDVVEGISVGVYDGAMNSGYYAGTPLIIYVSERIFADPVRTAEIVLHESLHQKLADLGVARDILRAGYVDESSELLPVPWGGPGRLFSADRSLAAYHVYTHQSLFYLALLCRYADDPARRAGPAGNLVKSWARARHFARGTETPALAGEYGVDGRRLTAWLAEVVDALAEVPLPGGSPLSAHAENYTGVSVPS